MKCLFIINPYSGKGKSITLCESLKARIKEIPISCIFTYTEYAQHATALALQASKQGVDVVVVLGGDGTLHEAANGLLQNPDNRTALSVCPVGTGNDFAAAYQLRGQVDSLINRLCHPKYSWQDVIELQDACGWRTYCVSMCGIGFDAFIAREANIKKKSGRRGKLIYLTAALRAIRRYRPVNIQFHYNGINRTETMLSMALGIHKTNGGGLMQCPHAVPDDGFIAVTLIRPLTLPDVLQALPKLFTGKLHTHKKVEVFQTKMITLESAVTVPVETDGEDAGILPVKAIILPGALRVMI
ncbi:MAG: diacylglycerol/lipid kinase family protein [Bacteroidota bacterium]